MYNNVRRPKMFDQIWSHVDFSSTPVSTVIQYHPVHTGYRVHFVQIGYRVHSVQEGYIEYTLYKYRLQIIFCRKKTYSKYQN